MFQNIIIAMRKAGTYRLLKPVRETGKISPANTKVSRADAQSRSGGILLSSDNCKLCFDCTETFSVHQNLLAPLPLAAAGGTRSEVVRPAGIFDMRQALYIASPLKSAVYVN